MDTNGFHALNTDHDMETKVPNNNRPATARKTEQGRSRTKH